MSEAICECVGGEFIVAGKRVRLLPFEEAGRCADCGKGRACSRCGESRLNDRHRETYRLILDGAVTAIVAGGSPEDVPAPWTCPDALSAEWRKDLESARAKMHTAGWRSL